MKARDRIKIYCIARGISQRKLGEAARLAKQEVGHVGSGRYMQGAAVNRLAKAMGVDPDWLVRGRGAPPPWARPMMVDLSLPAVAQVVRGLEEAIAELRADVAKLKAGVATKRPRRRT